MHYALISMLYCWRYIYITLLSLTELDHIHYIDVIINRVTILYPAGIVSGHCPDDYPDSCF